MRPLVRPVIMTAGKQEPDQDIKPPAASECQFSVSLGVKGCDFIRVFISLVFGMTAIFGI